MDGSTLLHALQAAGAPHHGAAPPHPRSHRQLTSAGPAFARERTHTAACAAAAAAAGAAAGGASGRQPRELGCDAPHAAGPAWQRRPRQTGAQDRREKRRAVSPSRLVEQGRKKTKKGKEKWNQREKEEEEEENKKSKKTKKEKKKI